MASTTFSWLEGGGEMGTLIRSLDCSKTPIGPVESWSPALRMMVRFLLANRFPLLLWWGPQYVSIYNDRNVSHEFRTPLTLLVGPLEDGLADTAPLPPVQRERRKSRTGMPCDCCGS